MMQQTRVVNLSDRCWSLSAHIINRPLLLTLEGPARASTQVEAFQASIYQVHELIRKGI